MKPLKPRKVILLFLTGCAIGLVLIRLGWAETSHSAKKHHPKHKTHSHKTHQTHRKTGHPAVAHHAKSHKPSTRIASRQQVQRVPEIPSKGYTHPDGLYALQYPGNWRLKDNDNAMIVKSAGENMNRGVFGVVRRPDDQPNDEAVAKEFQAPNRPADLRMMQTQVAGLPATKVIGSNREDPRNQMVEYYVQGIEGHQYYILMMAPRNEWNRYSVSFNGMLRSLSLN